ncbi:MULTISPECIES: M1 family aminopeptidase [unclassified Brevundimonas]|uniref:M1 family aminopeptidase n=1 Tax=unclassified Brevundimonas TaxID=2622653 RepID=UPI0006F98063|nr:MULTISPECIES: M1 family aminopeptidase [unclassified Brevundimonas]KQY86543.1 aminopeptidase [Brevundimonas sp. Root1423]KRA28767.1 aminopeptidase [Brevundimonas sp. Root608]
MFAKIASFEFRYQLRQPAFWVIAIVFGLLAFGAVASDNVSLGSGGNVLKNAPYALAGAHIVFNVFFMLATTAIVANVVARDTQTGFGPMILSTRITKGAYLYGRFFGAFAAVALCYLSIALGTLIGTFMPWVDPETIGPLRVGDYAYAYGVFGLTGLFLTSALFFMLATVTRSMMATYIGVVAVLIAYLASTGVLGQRPEFETAMAWAEPFGSGAYALVTKYWTAAERNTLNAPLEGVLLWNRVIWTAVGALLLAASYVLYRPSPRGAKLRKQERLKALVEKDVAVTPVGALPRPTYGLSSALTQLWSRTVFETVLIFKSPAYVVLILLGFAFAMATLFFTGEIYGAPILLVTRVVITGLTGAFGLISIVIAIYYAGELVWRDRDRKVHEIVDASATPDWTFLVPKTLALALVLVSTALAGVLAGVVTQTIKGYTDYELEKYLLWYVFPQAVSFGLLAVLAIFIQALSPNKFIGWAIMVVYLISTIVLSNLGFDHVLYRYGAGIGVPLSDMNGQGDFVVFSGWLDAYWTAFAIILLVLAYGLWRRGTEQRLWPRLKRLPHRLMGPAGVIGGAALAVFIGLGVFIYTNTNVWNEYRTQSAQEKEQAAYEKALLRYEATPQPSVADVRLVMDLRPHQPKLTTRGAYVLVNNTDAPLTEVHLRWQDDLDMVGLTVEGASVAREWEDFEYRIYRFATPMQPGERRNVTFETVLEQRGFKARGNTTRLVDNGSFVNNMEFAPMIGMDRQGLLTDRTKRRKAGLPAELRPAKLEDTAAQARNYIGADWVTADITVSTDADQTLVAPGRMVSDVVRDGRRTSRFVTESPVLNFFSIQSARYEQTRRMHNGVELVVFHDPGHDRNVPRMLDALSASLDYFQANFSPYQFTQARIVEFPDYASFAQSYPNTFAWSEGLGFIADLRDPEKIDYVTYVAAHEFAHQWWAHQIVGSNQQGATSLSETLAQYSALMVMEKTYGKDQIRRFLKQELDRYLRSRGTERLEELPLMRVENQQYIHYQKGGLVMYLLRDQIGEDAVNRALRRVLAQYAFKGAPYPRSLDLVAAIRAEAPADKQALITDLFEKITVYDVKTTGMTSTKRADGRWDVTVTVDARKLYVDGKGVETEAPLNETFDIGLFTAEPGKGAFNARNVVLLERRPIRSGVQTLRFVTTRAPSFGGVDPYNKWIDRNSDDNLRAVEQAG